MNALVKIGGYIYHMLPCAGWGNHSFYNYSPTFFTDIYHAKYGWKMEILQFFIMERINQKTKKLKKKKKPKVVKKKKQKDQ